jgi:uncharacterized repeat protein (TIGR01451 family)
MINGTGDISNNVTVVVPGQNNTGDSGINNSTKVDPAVNLTITKTVNATNVTNGDYLTYTITVINNGPYKATGIVIKDVLDSRLIYISSSTANGYYTSGTGLWILNNDLNIGGSATLLIYVRLNGTGTFGNDVNVDGLNEVNVGDSNASSNITFSHPNINLTVSKVANVENVNVGQIVTYTITVSNIGLDTAKGVSVYDYLPDSIQYVNSSATIGFYNSDTGLWYVGDLAPGASVILIINTRAIKVGSVVNMVEITTTSQPDIIIASTPPVVINEEPVDPPEPIKPNKTNETNNDIGGIAMKNTGAPGFVIIMVLLSAFALAVIRRKK